MEEEEAGSEAQASGPVQYQCLDCLALFDSPETWLEHRRTHSRSSTHSNTETVVRNVRLLVPHIQETSYSNDFV